MEVIKLDLIPGKKMPSLHTSQYDDGREHGIDLFENGVVYKLDGTETLTINERKGDDCICSLDIVNTFAETNHIVFASTEQMCAVWGNNICELVIAKGGKTIGTLNFILEIEQSPTEGGIESESEIKNLKRQIEAITEEVIGDDYYTAEETDEAIATATEGKADTTYVNTELAKKADKTDTYTKSQVDNALNGKADKDTTYTKTQVDSEISRLGGKIDTKANASDVYTKSQTNTLLNGKANASDVYTKQTVDALLNDKADVSDLPDMSQYYDKNEVDTALGTKADKSDFETLENAVSGLSDDVETLDQNKADKSDTYTKEQVDDIVYGILPNDTASGSVANFTTSLELPLKSLEVDVNAVQEAGTPTPATPLPISGWSEINLYKLGGNFFNKNSVENGKLINASGNEVSYADWNLSDYIEVIEGSSYYLYGLTTHPNTNQDNFELFNASKVKVGYANVKTNEQPYVIPSGVAYIKCCVKNQDLDTVQLGVSVNASFVPYNPTLDKYVIDLGGTCYGGHFTQDKAGHRRFEVTHSDLTDLGSFTWNASPDGYTQTPVIDGMKKTASSSSMPDMVCDTLKVDTSINVYNKVSDNSISIAFTTANSGLRVYMSTLAGLNAAQVKSALSGIFIAYPLETPIIIDLPDGEPIITLNGTNNIYADTGDCAVEYKCSVAEYVANHSGGGGAKSLGGVFLGSSKGGSEEEPTEESEETEKTKEIDEPKEEIKTIGDEPISKK